MLVMLSFDVQSVSQVAQQTKQGKGKAVTSTQRPAKSSRGTKAAASERPSSTSKASCKPSGVQTARQPSSAALEDGGKALRVISAKPAGESLSACLSPTLCQHHNRFTN